MYCSKCGMQNDSNNIFCQNCGEVLNKNSSMSMEENNTNINYQPQQETNYQPNEVKIENQNTFNTQQASQYSSDYNFNENKSKKNWGYFISIRYNFFTYFVILHNINTNRYCWINIGN